MRRKKHLDRGGGGGGGGTELFICFTSRLSTASAAGAPATLRSSSSSNLLSPGGGGGAGAGAGAGAGVGSDAAAPPFHPSLSRRCFRNSGSLKGGQSPMFPSVSSGGRRCRGGFEPAEPSSPKVTCIGQVRVKGGKRKPKHACAAPLRSRSRRGSAEASFRRDGDDRDGPAGKNQGWVYQIPVNICEAVKTFGSCGGRSLCSPSRAGGDRGALSAGAAGEKKRRRPPASGNWLCGAAVARCLLAIQEEDDDVGNGAAVVPADDVKASELGLVMEGWDVEERAVVVGKVEVEKKDEILVVGKEEEGRVSVCIPPRNALLLMRCRSDPVRMEALATRFWGSPAAANVGHVGNIDDDDEEEHEEDEGDAATDKEGEEQARDSVVSIKEAECRECDGAEDGGGEAGEVPIETEAVESSECGDLGEEAKDGGGCRGDEEEKIEPKEVPIVQKDSVLEVSLAGEIQVPEMVEAVVESKEEVSVPRPDREKEEMKGRMSSSSCSPSTGLKEDRKLRRLSSRRHVGTNSRGSLGGDGVGRRHSFSAEIEARCSSFSSLKDPRRASFSIDRDGCRWSFSIEPENLVAEPKVLMGSRKGQTISSETESEKDLVVHAAPNSAEEVQESHDDGKVEATLDREEEGTAQGAGVNEKGEKAEVRGVEAEDVVEEQKQRTKKSGELPDCLRMMLYEPKLSMEVSKETWVCSTDFGHWKPYQGENHHRLHQKTGCNAAASVELKDADNVEVTSDAKNTEESQPPASANLASMPPPAVEKPPPEQGVEQKLNIELPLVTAVAAYAPFVLKRCKSEPMRSSTRLAADACSWKDRHRPLDATGVGF
ncbi:hypothetical protein GUJ93_ZPchr0012g21100 [Zizania palustris]|uniref:Chloroplast protein HCF243 n=1 Tax=Zizania palustris TaxID=103762 RepID=A0A8J5WP88_ZIZPA|nr:hypothetical protein GUJ93_ZPchr0012g21100 [Zizania palustris]